MPVTLSYPGVYVEELPSGVRTITGVATSIAAFVGWSAKGPTDRAVRVFGFDDYVKTFGDLDPRSYLGYAVQSFFLNGGQDAYVLRLVHTDATTATFTSDSRLTLTAKSPGKWANAYRVRITRVTDAKLLANAAKERRSALPEYREHASDLALALGGADTSRMAKGTGTPP